MDEEISGAIVSGDVETIVIKPDPIIDDSDDDECDSFQEPEDLDNNFRGNCFVTPSGEVVALDDGDVIQTPFYLENYFNPEDVDKQNRSPSPVLPEILEVDRVTCYECDIVFCNEHKLLEHMMTHIDIYSMGCDICDKDLKKEEKLQLHMMTVTWQCIYYCDFCRKSCAGVVRSKTHPPPPGKTYMCHDCEIESQSDMFVPKQGLRMEPSDEVFPLKPTMIMSQDNQQNQANVTHDECQYFSLIGKTTAETQHCCILQKSILPKNKDDENDEQMVRESLGNKQKSNKIRAVRQFKCKYCPMGFLEHFQLMKHLNEKHQFHKLKYVCKYCNKEFVQQRCFINHVNFHQISNQNMCYMCNVAFFSKCELDDHLKFHDRQSNSIGKFIDSNQDCVPMDLSTNA